MSESTNDTLYEAVGLLRVLARSQLEALADELADDDLAWRVLTQTADGWVSSGDLMTALDTTSSAEKKRIQRKCAELVRFGLLLRRGAKSGTRYRSTGLL